MYSENYGRISEQNTELRKEGQLELEVLIV